MDLGLAGKVALVTGASRGLGRAVADLLASEGASVAIAARDPKALEAAAREIRARCGAEVFFLPTDVTREDQVASLEKKMRERGYLEGSEMGNTFNLLRANDLIWSFVINNYLLGRDPFPFDLLHWNCDSTRMPAQMHSYYLRNMYMRNKLREPGGLTLSGVPIDLSKVSLPTVTVSPSTR